MIISPHNDALIRAYFDAVHVAFPIIDPKNFRRSSAAPSLLASIYALAQPYCADARHTDPKPLLDFTSQALPIEARSAKLETVEAALLHAQRHTYTFRAPTMPGLWAEVGSLVGISHDIGLNIDASDWDITIPEKRRRKRLWWAVYMQDKWAALTLGRPPYLNDEQHDVTMVQVSDFETADSPLSDKESVAARTFIAHARLAKILSGILSRLYSVKGVKQMRSIAVQEVCDVVSHFTQQLEAWKQETAHPLIESELTFDPTGKATGDCQIP